MRSPKNIVALNAVTATTTSSAIDVEGAKKVTILATRADHGSGSTAFTVSGSLDGTTFVSLPLVVQAATTNSQTITRTVAPSLAANGSAWYSVDLEYLTLKEIKVTATETTDGTHSAVVRVEY